MSHIPPLPSHGGAFCPRPGLLTPAARGPRPRARPAKAPANCRAHLLSCGPPPARPCGTRHCRPELCAVRAGGAAPRRSLGPSSPPSRGPDAGLFPRPPQNRQCFPGPLLGPRPAPHPLPGTVSRLQRRLPSAQCHVPLLPTARRLPLGRALRRSTPGSRFPWGVPRTPLHGAQRLHLHSPL